MTRHVVAAAAVAAALFVPANGDSSLRAAQGDRSTADVRQYCTPCHNERAKARAGGLSLEAFDVSRAEAQADVAEKMIRKLRAGMMPPPGARRPDPPALEALASDLETRVDRAAAATPNPGWRPFQRLNRPEYARAVRDLLGIDVDVGALLPPDTISQGFDNVADSQVFSPTVVEAYLRAAARVAALAIGDPEGASGDARYRVPKTASQLQRVDGAPFGTRGGVSVVHTFPADGDYVFTMDLHGNADGFLFGGPTPGEQLELSIDGARKALLDIDPRMAEVTTSLTLKTPNVRVTAGPHRVTAAFVQRFEGPVNDLIAPIDHTLADTQIGVAYGLTTLPHLKDLTVSPPKRVTGVSETISRRRVFVCRPTRASEARPCAARIVERLGTQAFRHPLSDRELGRLMAFYDEARKTRDFEGGIASALEAMLASPQFVFRIETPRPAAAGTRARRLSDPDLATRLSFFIWGTTPDAELLKIAGRGLLSAPGGVARQVKRMLADPRSEALSTRFATQWLRLNDVRDVLPDAILFPYFDRTVGDAFVRETQLLFDSLVREDRSILDLLTADYTFVNERLARHYGIPNITGHAFRRVAVPEYRRGILGHGSMLVPTSAADRTSPVMRGKWVMEVLLGSPPPPPPDDVPALEATAGVAGGKLLSVRERMEQHRRDPTCNSCHRVIDPLGLALEHFDADARWRINDNGAPVDASGVMYDGTPLDGPAALRNALLNRQVVVLRTFTENLMTYALGRRVEYDDMPAVRAIVAQAARQNYRMSAFVLGVVESAAFQMTADAPSGLGARASGVGARGPGRP